MSCACVNETEKETRASKAESQARVESERWALPRADVVESEEGFVVTLDLPGVGKDALDVTLEDRTLTVVGRRENALAGEPLHRESRAAGYRRVFSLGESVDPVGISAGIRNGVARLTLPKVVEAKPRRIAVIG
jgi:HSP20 family protein